MRLQAGSALVCSRVNKFLVNGRSHPLAILHRIVCHLMKGGVLRAMMGKLRTIPRLVVAGDHHPPPQIALILVAGVKQVGMEEEGIPRVHLHKYVLATKLLSHLYPL